MTTMKAAIVREYGSPDKLEIAQFPVPEIDPGELLIKVGYAGVNPADWKLRAGLISHFVPLELPFAMGLDMAGVVAEVGEGVAGFAIGDRVCTNGSFTKAKPGSYAEYAVAQADMTSKVPEAMSLKEAAAIPSPAVTCWQAVFYDERGALKKGQKMLFNGGAGGMGSYGVQFGKWAGAEVATTCGPDNLDYVRSLGVDLAINYREQNIAEEIAKWSAEGVDVIVDVVGICSLPLVDAANMLKEGGRLFRVPTMTADGDIEAEMAESAKLGIDTRYDYMQNPGCGKEIQKICQLVVEGSIQMPPIEVFALDDAADAHRKIEDGHVRGKLVLEVGGEAVSVVQ